MKREQLQPEIQGESEMENSMYPSHEWFQTLLLLFGGGGPYGYGGFGRGRGHGHGGGAGPYTDFSLFEKWANTVDKSTFFQAQQASQAANKDLANQVGLGVRDVEKSISDAEARSAQQHCDLQSAIDRCCCETQKEIVQSRFTTEMGMSQIRQEICDQTADLKAQGLENCQRVLDSISRHAEAETQAKLAAALNENSQLKQTNELASILREKCCNENGNGHWPPWYAAAPTFVPPGHGGTPPGQGKK
jgi:hypothetical protein